MGSREDRNSNLGKFAEFLRQTQKGVLWFGKYAGMRYSEIAAKDPICVPTATAELLGLLSKVWTQPPSSP